jgi:hypothetical protein
MRRLAGFLGDRNKPFGGLSKILLAFILSLLKSAGKADEYTIPIQPKEALVCGSRYLLFRQALAHFVPSAVWNI